mgnify:CR=1 FL=1
MGKLITWGIILIILAIVAWPIDFLTLTDDTISNSLQHLFTGIISGILLVIGIVLLIINKYKK